MKGKFDEIRNKVMEAVSETLANPYDKFGYDVLETGSNELCVPIVNTDGEEGYLVITFKIPKGSRDGEEFDGYALAEDFKLKQEQKEIEAKEKLEKKLKKIERDKKIREQKKNSKGE